jgi:hypothetical protein
MIDRSFPTINRVLSVLLIVHIFLVSTEQENYYNYNYLRTILDPRSTNAGITEVAADLLADNIYVSGGFDESGSKYLEVPSSKY